MPFFGLSQKGAADAADGRSRWRRKPHHLRDGQPRSGDHPRGGGTEIRDDAIMATGRSGLSEPGQQRSWLPLYLPRRARRSRQRRSTMEMKIACGRGAGTACPRGRAGRGRGRLSGFARPRYGPRIHHPRALRSAPDPCRNPGRGRQGRDGDSGVARASRSSTWKLYKNAALRAPLIPIAGTLKVHHGRAFVRRYPKRVVFAEGEEEQRDPRRRLAFRQCQGLGHRDPRRPRGADQRGRRRSSGVDLQYQGHRRSVNARLSHRKVPAYAQYPLRAAAAAGLSVP